MSIQAIPRFAARSVAAANEDEVTKVTLRATAKHVRTSLQSRARVDDTKLPAPYAVAMDVGHAPRPIAGKMAAELQRLRNTPHMDHETLVDYGFFRLNDKNGRHIGYGMAVFIKLDGDLMPDGNALIKRTCFKAFDLAGNLVSL